MSDRADPFRAPRGLGGRSTRQRRAVHVVGAMGNMRQRNIGWRSTTCSRASPSPPARPRARSAQSERATTRRWWQRSRRKPPKSGTGRRGKRQHGNQQTADREWPRTRELPGKLALLIESVANVLDSHREALNPRDANARREDEAYRELAQLNRKVGEDLRAIATRMAGYRNLAMAKHDEKAMASPKAVQAFERFVTLEGQVGALFQRRLIGDRAMLDQMRGAR